MVPSADVRACTNLTLNWAYANAASVLVELGSDSRVVKEICEAVDAENATDGIPSRAASHAAPLQATVR